MKTSEILQLQALKLKREITRHDPAFDHAEDAPAWMRDTYDTGADSRNICGMIPASLFDEVERLAGALKISKRAMIEMALRDIAVSANTALDDAGFEPSSVSFKSVGDVPVDEA